MSTLGNSEAVRKVREGRPGKPSPAEETAERRAAETPERRGAKRAPEPVDEFAEDLRRAIPGIPDEAIETLRKEFRKG